MRAFWLCLCGVLLLSCRAGELQAKSPNIVLIIADDQCYRDFGFMGNTEVRTPHLDLLAQSSAWFAQGYVPTSVCSPSLATLLTGLYPHQHGIHYNHPPPGNAAFNRMTSVDEYVAVRSRSFGRIRQLDTLPRRLARQGYRSLQTGKFWEGHYSNAGFTTGMTRFEPVPGQEYGGNRRLASGDLVAHGNGDWGLKIGRETMEPIRQFLDEGPAEQPFLIWYAPYLPHQPHDSPERFYEGFRDPARVPPHKVPYYASIAWFDETVGQLMGMLESRGLRDNTLVVFVSDNGWTADTVPERSRPEEYRHTVTSKRAPFEDGLRTPILFSMPGTVPEGRRGELISSVDLFATLLEAVRSGLSKAGDPLPGRNLWADILSQNPLSPRPVMGEIYPGDASFLGHPERDIAYRWIRDGDFKLIVPHSREGLKPWGGYLEKPALYDLSLDPGETVNLLGSPSFAAVARRLSAQLDAWWKP